MNHFPIDVAPSGAILLGDRISCDGFRRDYNVRVQTHVHMDHMDHFDRSKGLQEILMSDATRRILIAEMNADLPYRSNIRTLDRDETYAIDGQRVALVSSGHMLGAVQVRVEMPDGMVLGYSGDFQWPLDQVIEVDALVVDSTYGSPESRRLYSQEDVEAQFTELIRSNLRLGPVHLQAYRGTLNRALSILAGTLPNCPLIGSPRLCRDVAVYRELGYPIDALLPLASNEADEVMRSQRFIRLYGRGDGLPLDVVTGTRIVLSAYMTQPDDPLLVYSERSYRLAMSDHADFEGTIEYVRATGARLVVTDNSRGGHALELAVELQRQLGIEARPSSGQSSREWGI